jgi:hypothetical protein
MPNIIRVAMDREVIRLAAYFLSQKNLALPALARLLVQLEFPFRNEAALKWEDPVVEVDLDTFDPPAGLFEKGRWEHLRYGYYTYQCQYPAPVFHWLIAERQYLLDCLREQRNFV